MAIRIERLTKDLESSYADLLRRVPESMVFQTLPYRDFLAKVLGSSEERYLVAVEDGAVVGALPAFLKKNERYGNVLNSLPFYGSNGGVLVEPSRSDVLRVQCALLRAFQAVAEEEQVVSSTIVSSPLAPLDELYRTETGHNFLDERIGQLTPLPRLDEGAGEAEIVEALFRMYPSKTRNVVRASARSGAVVEHDGSVESLRVLASIHEDNMKAIGGQAKPWRVFEALRATFAYDTDYRVYSAKLDGVTIASLLVFFHNRTCEYFTPATVAEFRDHQPGSLLIHRAMIEAVRRRCARWNWGGTWISQKGVYDFKSKWATMDVTYRYWVREYPHSVLRSLDRDTILREYPYFYTVPFGALSGATQ